MKQSKNSIFDACEKPSFLQDCLLKFAKALPQHQVSIPGDRTEISETLDFFVCCHEKGKPFGTQSHKHGSDLHSLGLWEKMPEELMGKQKILGHGGLRVSHGLLRRGETELSVLKQSVLSLQSPRALLLSYSLGCVVQYRPPVPWQRDLELQFPFTVAQVVHCKRS